LNYISGIHEGEIYIVIWVKPTMEERLIKYKTINKSQPEPVQVDIPKLKSKMK
jgi:hypothetical protein